VTIDPGRKPVLPRRLRDVADLVPPGARVADVGSGHGLLPQWLLARGRVRGCIAIERDRRVGARLLTLEESSGLEARFGDGLRALRPGDRPDVLVMSGLGTRSILRVLEQAGAGLADWRRVVLQPQTEMGRLRRWLIDRGLGLIAERIALVRGRFYHSIAAEPHADRARPSHPVLAFDDLMEAGPLLVASGDPRVRDYWRRTLERLDRVLERAGAGAGHARAARRRALAARVLEVLSPAPRIPGGS